MIYTCKAHGRNLAQSKQRQLAIIVVVVTWTLSGNNRHSVNVSILYLEDCPIDQKSRLNDQRLSHAVLRDYIYDSTPKSNGQKHYESINF